MNPDVTPVAPAVAGDTRQDRVIRWLLAASVAIAAISLAVAAFSLPTLIGTRTSVEEQRRAFQEQQRNSAVVACRSEIRAELDLATAVVDDLILDGLSAALTGDEAAISNVLFRSIPARAARDQAVEAVKHAAQHSADDPDGFLATCRTPA